LYTAIILAYALVILVVVLVNPVIAGLNAKSIPELENVAELAPRLMWTRWPCFLAVGNAIVTSDVSGFLYIVEQNQYQL